MIPVVAFAAVLILAVRAAVEVRRIRWYRREDAAQQARAASLQPLLTEALAERRQRPERPARPSLTTTAVPVIDLSRAS